MPPKGVTYIITARRSHALEALKGRLELAHGITGPIFIARSGVGRRCGRALRGGQSPWRAVDIFDQQRGLRRAWHPIFESANLSDEHAMIDLE